MRPMFYEDFSNGDFSSAEKVVADIGVPRRSEVPEQPRRVVTKIADDINAEWGHRFRSEAGPKAREIMVQYESWISGLRHRSSAD